MQAKIVTEKIVVRGEKMRKIMRFEGVLGRDALPVAYLNTRDVPLFYSNEPSNMPGIYHAPAIDKACCWIYEGDIIQEAAFQELLVWMRRAGARLAKINARLAKENTDWHGEEEVEI